MCPQCGKISAIKSHKASFKCESCGKQWEYGEDLHIHGDGKFSEIVDWYGWEKERLQNIAANADVADEILHDENIKFYESIRFKRKQKLDGNAVTAGVSGITVKSAKTNRTFCWGDIEGLAIVQRNRVDFYYDGKTYQIRGDKRFCPLKYLDLYEGVRL